MNRFEIQNVGETPNPSRRAARKALKEQYEVSAKNAESILYRARIMGKTPEEAIVAVLAVAATATTATYVLW